MTAFTCRADASRAACSGVVAASTRARPAVSAPSKSATSRRAVIVVDDRLQGGVVEVAGPEPVACHERQVPVAAGRVHVEEEHQPVVESRPPDAPLGAQGRAVVLDRLCGRPRLHLGVHDDLGPGSIGDRRDDGVGTVDGGRREDARRVVDALAGNRARERRSGGVGRPRDGQDGHGQEAQQRPGDGHAARATDRRAARRIAAHQIAAHQIAARTRRTSSAACS